MFDQVVTRHLVDLAILLAVLRDVTVLAGRTPPLG
jgi:hypothetical protein